MAKVRLQTIKVLTPKMMTIRALIPPRMLTTPISQVNPILRQLQLKKARASQQHLILLSTPILLPVQHLQPLQLQSFLLVKILLLPLNPLEQLKLHKFLVEMFLLSVPMALHLLPFVQHQINLNLPELPLRL